MSPTTTTMSDTKAALKRTILDMVELDIAGGAMIGTPEAFEQAGIPTPTRVSNGPCIFCGEVKELRYGGCFSCVIEAEGDDE